MFIGLVNYFRDHVPYMTELMKPLRNMHNFKSYEPICQSLTVPIGFLQSSITFTTPDAHCHKVERAIQQIDQKVIATLAAMTYVLPPSLVLYAKKYCADFINTTPPSTLSPDTAP